jgi:methylenetetrahydrofolate reductase (NADH)
MNTAPDLSPELAIQSRLVRTLLNGDFALTAEVTPPASCDAARLLERAEPLRGWVDAVNVTDGASARVAMSSLAAAALLVRDGFEPVLQFTCRDRNRIALQADLLGAAALGIHNLLILRGDEPDKGDQPDAKPVFDIESRELIGAAARMRDDGVMPSGRALDPAPAFFIGAADTPIDPPSDWWPEGLDGKAKAGAQFVQTQLCYDIEVVRRYIARLTDLGLTDRLFILIGIGPLASARAARWMRDNLWGVVMPEAIIDRLDGAADPGREGVRICAELLQQLAEIPGVSGAHLMAPLNTASIPAALEQSGLLKLRAARA